MIGMLDWFLTALNEYGVHEIAGPEHSSRIIDYHSATTLKATKDEVPWCSSFACWCLQTAGYPTTKSAAARSWLAYGNPIKTFQMGCIVILERGSNPAQGHVGFGVCERDGVVYVLGGNQNDRVSIAAYSKNLVLGYRWPFEPNENAIQ